MPETRLTISLSDEDASYLNKKLAAEEFASADDIVHEALELLRGVDSERNLWEREELIPAIEQYEEDPSSGLNYEQVRHHLSSRRAERRKAS